MASITWQGLGYQRAGWLATHPKGKYQDNMIALIRSVIGKVMELRENEIILSIPHLPSSAESF